MLTATLAHSKPKLITSAMLEAATNAGAAAVRPLELEFGQLFFGYPVVPYTPPATPPTAAGASSASTSGVTGVINRPSAGAGAGAGTGTGGIGLSVLDSLRGGNTLSGRPTRSATPVSVPDVVITPDTSTTAGAGAEAEQPRTHEWGTGGQTLGSARSSGVKKSGEKKKKKREVIEID